jgi:hypothetical protein
VTTPRRLEELVPLNPYTGQRTKLYVSPRQWDEIAARVADPENMGVYFVKYKV